MQGVVAALECMVLEEPSKLVWSICNNGICMEGDSQHVVVANVDPKRQLF